jgi:cholesterol transport system auxiliary component
VNRSAVWAVALPLIGLAACTGSLFRSKIAPPTVYMLSAGAGSTQTASTGSTDAAVSGAGSTAAPSPGAVIPADLAVLKPKLRTGLETDRIAVLYPDRHLDYFADARWSGPLGDVLQDFAVQEFHTRANLRTVSGDASVFPSAYWLEMEVTDFQAEYTSAAAAPTVHVQILARVGNSGDRRVLGRFVANARQQAAENRLTAIVDAYALAADAALADIVAHADDTLAKASEAGKSSEGAGLQKLDSPVASTNR